MECHCVNYVQNVTQHPALKVNSTRKEIIGITNVNFDATGQLLIIQTRLYLKMCLNET